MSQKQLNRYKVISDENILNAEKSYRIRYDSKLQSFSCIDILGFVDNITICRILIVL